MFATVLSRSLRYVSVALVGTVLGACGMMASSSTSPPTSQLNVATLTTAVNFGTSAQAAQFVGTKGPNGPSIFLTSSATNAKQEWTNSLELTSNFSSFVQMRLPRLSAHSLASAIAFPKLTIDSVSFPTSTFGWVVATESGGSTVLLHTTDGSATWSIQKIFTTLWHAPNVSVSFSSRTDGYVQVRGSAGNPSSIYVTFNGGTTLHTLGLPTISSIVEIVGPSTVIALTPDPTNRGALGLTISHNGGQSFTSAQTISPSNLSNPVLLGQRAKGSTKILLALAGTTSPTTRTIDIVSVVMGAGHSTLISSVSTPASSGIPSMVFVSPKAWFVSFVGASGAVTVKWSADAGNDWSTSVSTSLPTVDPSKLMKAQPLIPPVTINYLSQPGRRRLLVTEAGLLSSGGISTTTYLLDATTIESIPPS